MCIGAPAHCLPVLSYLANIKFEVVGGVHAIGLDNGDGERVGFFQRTVPYRLYDYQQVVEEKYYVQKS
jgi:hypothetical protein